MQKFYKLAQNTVDKLLHGPLALSTAFRTLETRTSTLDILTLKSFPLGQSWQCFPYVQGTLESNHRLPHSPILANIRVFP